MEETRVHVTTQWGIDDIDLMKTASSAGVETFLSWVPSLVRSIRKMGMVVGACTGIELGVSQRMWSSSDVCEGDVGSETWNSVASCEDVDIGTADRGAQARGARRGGGGQ